MAAPGCVSSRGQPPGPSPVASEAGAREQQAPVVDEPRDPRAEQPHRHEQQHEGAAPRHAGADDEEHEGGEQDDDEQGRHEGTEHRCSEGGGEGGGPRAVAPCREGEPGQHQGQQDVADGEREAAVGGRRRDHGARAPRQGGDAAGDLRRGHHPAGEVGRPGRQRRREQEQPGHRDPGTRPAAVERGEPLREPRDAGEHGEVRSGLDPGAESGSVPGVAERMPQAGGIGRDRPQLPSGQARVRGRECPGTEGRAPGDHGGDEHGADRQHAGVAEDASRERDGQGTQPLRLVGRRPRLGRGGGLAQLVVALGGH